MQYISKKLFLFILFLTSFSATSQGEANNWFFGYGAGLVFDNINNTVTPSADAQNSISTFEGCSSISDPSGNLQFYTDGRDVWDANHTLMPNANYFSGSGLLGDPSSTSSAVIIPKPGDLEKYYIFTVDEPHHQNAWAYPESGPAQEDGSPTFDGTYSPGDGVPDEDDGFNNGLNYSLVDMALNTGMGDIDPSEKNIPLLTYNTNIQEHLEYKCAEKITAVEHADGQSYWVLTHFVNAFYAFRVDSNGVNTAPSISNVAPSISVEGYRRNGIGYIKSSPNGEKIAIAHSQNDNQEGGNADNGSCWIYDFNQETGQVSNPIEVLSNDSFYGVAFSQNSEKVYFSSNSGVQQIDLTAVNLPDSATFVYQDFAFMGAMQLGPDGKIYVCNTNDQSSLDVINDPNASAADVDYVYAGQPLAAGTFAGYGLPPFIQSFLVANISYVNDCLGSSTEFLLSTSETIVSLEWDFGDSETSTEINPQHVYTSPGEYTASVVITTATETQTFETLVIIFDTPTANSVEDISVCDDDNDGVNSFDFIADVTPTVLGTQDPLGFSVTYHPTQEDADLNTNAYVIPYSNVLTQESVFVRIENVNNITCYDTTSFVIEVFDTPVIAAINDLQNCDDGTDGDLTNGQTETDLSALTAVVLGAQDTTLFNVSYHLDTTDANAGANALPLIYYNTTAFNQTLFVRIENTTNTNCYTTEQFNIIVNTTPTANAVLDIAICDDDNDGVNSFDFIADVTPTVLGAQDPLGFSVTYHPTQEDADLNTNAYVIPYSNVLTQESVFVRIENVNNVTCYDTTSFVIEVFDTPVIAAINDLQNCDDGTDGDLTNGQTETDLSALTAVVLGAQDTTLFNVSYHLDTTDANAGANALPLIYYNTTAFNQTLFVRIENTTNTNCYTTEQFNIIVNTTPTANAVLDIAICDDDNDGVNSFDFIADVTPTVLGDQDPLGFSVTYHPTQEDADLNTNAYVIPYSNVLTQESVFVRIENVNNITCYDTTSFVIEVFDTPVIAAINDLQNCDDGTDGDLTNGQTETDLSALTAVVLGAQDTTLFNVSYHLDTTDANAGANALPLIYYNTTAFNQTLFVRIENTTNTNCYTTEQFNIIVNTTPTANAVLDIAICDDDNDGVNSFDFIADVTPTVLGDQDPLGFSVTYHPTQEDADLNTNAYVIPYSNVLTQESVFVRIENVNNITCYDTTSFVIEVFDTPVPPVDFEYYQCDYTNSGDLTEVFDLVALNADIINGQDLTITHYETEADAEAGTNPIVGLYTNTSPVQTIYVLLVSNILSDCTAVGSYTIGVDPLPNVIVDVPLVQCDIDDVQDGISIYNLEEVGENVIIGDDASNYSLTFHLSQADLDAGINAIPNPTSYVNLTPLQTIYTRVENIATTCYTTSFFFLETIFNPIPDDAGLIVCDNSEGNGNDYDGLGLFTLSDANDYILSLIVANPDNDITSPDQLTIAYYTSETNALLELDQLPNEYISEVADAQTLFLRVERDNDCFGINSMLLQVLPVPTYDEVPDEILCTYTPGFIEVDFVADYNPIILGSQAASEVIITYHTSQEDADTGVNALPNPYTVVEQITVFVREEVQNNDPLVTACFISNVSFTLTVEPRPEFVAPIPLIVCDDDDVLDGLTTIDISVQTETIMAGFEDNVVTYHVSEDDANAGENPLDLLYTTIVPDLQTIFVRIEDDMTAITGCYSITPYDLVVVRPPAATTPESYEYCDPDADGFGVFNLSSLDPEITGTLSNLVISYHETQSDAFNNINPIIGEYFNVVAYEQTIFVRIQDTTITTDCFSYVDFSIIVNDVPQIELTPDTLEVCDDDFDGFGLFDLSLANEQILNGLDPLEFEVTYYETPENAEAATNPIATPFSYTNLNPTNHEVYVRVENIITGCYNAVPLPLLVNPLPTIVLPTPLAICDDLLADSFTAFDLTVKNTEITLGDGSLEVVYYTSLLDAESANNAILDPTSYTNQAIDGAAPNPQTLHVRVTDLDTGCYDLTTLTIRVLPNPTPSPDPVDLELCDETSSGDGLEVFDLTTDEVFILNGELGVSASYYQTLEDAEAGENAIATPQAYTNIETPAQLIYVRVTNDLTGCYTLVDFNIIVHPLPQANVVSDLIACELDTDDVFDFDLESQTDLILGGQDPSLFEVTYHTSLLDAETGLNFLGSPYTNISDPEVIFVSVVNTDTGCRNTQLQFNLEVHEAAQAFAPLEFYVLCDDNVETDGDPSNDSVEFDLSVQDAFVLDGQDPLNYTVSYYASQSDADQGINALPMLYQNTVNPQVIIARVDNDIEVLDDTGALVDSSICYATALLTLNVDPLPIVLIDMDYILCVDTNGTEVLSPLEIETGLSSEDYTFIWSDATGVVVGTGSSYAPSQGGTYSLEVFDATLQTQCAAPVEVFTVIESTPPILTAQVTTAAFASTHVIEALATGQGVYEYSLDQGPWGDSGVFVDVTPGEHVVTARDLNGCGETQVVVYVIDYPLYFTPNGDGYNDTWNIVGVANQNNAKILIFDRFGKLLKQISPSGEGWDGTYNGAQLPSSDYWFTLDYTDPTTGNPQVLRAHFALKR